MAVRIPSRGSLPPAEIGSDVSQMHLMASGDGYDFFAACKWHKSSLSGLGLHVQYNVSVCRELSFFSWFHKASGSTCFPSFILTTVHCGRYYYYPHFTDEKPRLRDIRASYQSQ